MGLKKVYRVLNEMDGARKKQHSGDVVYVIGFALNRSNDRWLLCVYIGT